MESSKLPFGRLLYFFPFESMYPALKRRQGRIIENCVKRKVYVICNTVYDISYMFNRVYGCVEWWCVEIDRREETVEKENGGECCAKEKGGQNFGVKSDGAS